ncbi:hypothetical protein T439DRAFT_360233 [Meredithblackwellia eburnea MCA 4105]
MRQTQSSEEQQNKPPRQYAARGAWKQAKENTGLAQRTIIDLWKAYKEGRIWDDGTIVPATRIERRLHDGTLEPSVSVEMPLMNSYNSQWTNPYLSRPVDPRISTVEDLVLAPPPPTSTKFAPRPASNLHGHVILGEGSQAVPGSNLAFLLDPSLLDAFDPTHLDRNAFRTPPKVFKTRDQKRQAQKKALDQRRRNDQGGTTAQGGNSRNGGTA